MRVFNQKLTKKQLRTAICKFAKQIGVRKVIFNDKGKYVNGTYNSETRVLYLDNKQTKSRMLCTFFHELGHHTAVAQNKWKKYHYCLVPLMTANEVFVIENKIDQIGKKLWHKHVDIKLWGMYKYGYPKSQKNSIIKNFISKQ
jgi:hypothetical protein